MRSSARVLAVVLALLSVGCPRPAALAAPSQQASVASAPVADPGLRGRQRAALEEMAGRLEPMRSYPAGDDANCVRLNRDSYALVAALELDRRALGGISPEKGAPIARNIAQGLFASQGTRMRPGACAPGRFGGPGTMNAAAALAYALHRYGRSWPGAVKEAIGRPITSGVWHVPHYLDNLNIPVPVAALLAGEALDDRKLFERGATQLEAIFDRVRQKGGKELNAPLYTGHHIPNLLFLLDLEDARARTRARILLEYELLVSAHLYLPGGGLGVPKSRDYQGGIADGKGRGLLPLIWLLVGDPELEVDLKSAYNMLTAAATDYVLPSVIRSIFLDKQPGYTFRVRVDAHQGTGRAPRAVYGPRGGGSGYVPWQAVMLPSGRAMLGVAYGLHFAALAVTSGVEIRTPDGRFAHLYQYQPMVRGDTDETGRPFRGAGLDDDPDDFVSELYDFERLVFHRTAITLWDPRPRPGVRRTHSDTRVHVPDLSASGGESLRRDGWWIGRSGPAYVAYRPLGKVAETRVESGGEWTYLRIPGRGGGIVELSTTDEFPTIGSYADDLSKRHLSLGLEPLAAEFDARGPTGGTTRVKLEYAPERRFLDGRPWPLAAAMGDSLMESPWVRWDRAAQVLTVAREGSPAIRYDWRAPSITETAPPSAGTD